MKNKTIGKHVGYVAHVALTKTGKLSKGKDLFVAAKKHSIFTVPVLVIYELPAKKP